MDNAIFARGLQAFQEELRALGYTLLVASSSYRSEIEEEQIRSLVARGADGLLLIGHDRSPAIGAFLAKQNVPALVAWAYDPAATLPSIGFDNRAAMRALVDQVLALGHRDIAVISAATQTNDRARDRVEGIRDGLRAVGIDPANCPVIETTYEIESGARAFEALMRGDRRPTVVLCGNDVLAVGALKAARTLGLSVPGDVSITGFDDIELAQIAEPPLATVHVPHRDMGRGAARMLVEMVEGRSAGETRALEATLCLRGSLAAPAGGSGQPRIRVLPGS
jgi:LacI family transcriptional regulator